MAKPKQYNMKNSKGVVVEAHQVKVTSVADLEKFVGSELTNTAGLGLHIVTPSGMVNVQPGDWLVKLPDGKTFYGVSRSDFDEFYSEVEGSDE